MTTWKYVSTRKCSERRRLGIFEFLNEDLPKDAMIFVAVDPDQGLNVCVKSELGFHGLFSCLAVNAWKEIQWQTKSCSAQTNGQCTLTLVTLFDCVCCNFCTTLLRYFSIWTQSNMNGLRDVTLSIYRFHQVFGRNERWSQNCVWIKRPVAKDLGPHHSSMLRDFKGSHRPYLARGRCLGRRFCRVCLKRWHVKSESFLQFLGSFSAVSVLSTRHPLPLTRNGMPEFEVLLILIC